MALAPLASFAELQTYMPGVTLDEDQAEMVLLIASDTIRSAAGQDFTLVADDELVMRGLWGRDLVLPQRPVRSVASITVDGTDVLTTSYTVTSNGRVTFAAGCPVVNGPSAHGGSWGGSEVLVAAVYSHGYDEDEMPWDIKGMCLDVARRSILTPDAGVISQEALGSYSVSYSRQVASTLTSDERRKLRRYRFGQTTVTVGP